MKSEPNIMYGDLITLAETGVLDVIVHGCNCFCVMGAGIAKQISKKYPEVYKADWQNTKKGDKNKLGGFTWTPITMPNGHTFIVINAYTQYRYGSKGWPDVDYGAIRSVFKMIKVLYPDRHIGYPRIGCGQAGGDWNVVKDIINQELSGLNHTLVELKENKFET
jgi:O-acetyl-ADP-ribose deacetylase (regulator of RNase III)